MANKGTSKAGRPAGGSRPHAAGGKRLNVHKLQEDKLGDAMTVEKKGKITDLSRQLARGVDPVVYQQSIVNMALQAKKDELPHLYGQKWYKWAWEFFTARERMALLTAFNQASKSSTLIRLFIDWATDKSKWPDLWDTVPRSFMYFYPSNDIATREFETKWLPEFMPRGSMKNHKEYGWDATYDDGEIKTITFNTGVTIYFMTYGQKTINLQASTVHLIGADEEIPVTHLDELLARIRGSGGYYRGVFTATIGQELFYRAMERIGYPDEAFKGAWKRSVSMYDSQYYMDGSPSKWTLARIHEEESLCSSEAERQKRIMGRFVRDEGLQYGSFKPDIMHIESYEIPATWLHYAGVDLGGNKTAKRSKGAIVFVAVDPEMTKGVVYRTWRGDSVQTTAQDVFDRFIAMRGAGMCHGQVYDYGSADFGLIATRRGEPFLPAQKDRNAGVKRLNTLFQCNALHVFRDDESHKLISELLTVPPGNKNRHTIDDLTDALRYCIMQIPFDWSKISPTFTDKQLEVSASKPLTADELKKIQMEERRGIYRNDKRTAADIEFDNMCDALNEAYGN